MDGKSLIVSNKIFNHIDSGDLYDQLSDDIVLTNWEYFIQNSADFDVLILDMDLSEYIGEVKSEVPEIQITQLREEFSEFFKNFEYDVSYLLESGDTIIILLDRRFPVKVQPGKFGKSFVNSHDWIDSLEVLDDKKLITDTSPNVVKDSKHVEHFFNCVSEHYKMKIDHNTCVDTDILAETPDESYPAGFATNNFVNDTGELVESDGSLILLPMPKSLTKVHRLVENLVGIGWEYHDKERPEHGDLKENTGSMQLSTSIKEFDDELVEHCFSKFARGEYGDAATKALKILENRIKDEIGSEIDYSTTADLIKKAFRPSEDPLRMGEEPGEEEGVMFLYAGAIQGFRNPLSHRVVNPEKERYLDDLDQQSAHDIIAFANLLLSMINSSDN